MLCCPIFEHEEQETPSTSTDSSLNMISFKAALPAFDPFSSSQDHGDLGGINYSSPSSSSSSPPLADQSHLSSASSDSGWNTLFAEANLPPWKKQTIGVLQIINKKDGIFTQEDEISALNLCQYLRLLN